MASIIGDKYRYATDTSSGGWAVTDKIFGYFDQAGDIYNKIRYPQPGQVGYNAEAERLRAANQGMFGLQKPWGVILFIGGIGLLGFAVYKIANN
jgi:hypothetical protein